MELMEFHIPHHHPQRRIFVPVLSLRWVFVLTPRVASNAILDALARHHDIIGARTWNERSVLPALTLDEVKDQIPDWPRAMFVRNPFSRLIGVYEYHLREMKLQASWTLRELGFRSDMTFPEFLHRALVDPEADEHLAMQAWQTDCADFVGTFEHLNEDWAKLREKIGVDLPLLKIINGAGTRDPGQDYYNGDLRRKVEQVYDIDLRTFHYGL